MITKLAIFDFDGTLSMSPKPEDGIPKWEAAKGIRFTHDDWWGSPESLDTKVFNIRLFPNIANILKKEQANKNTEVIILSSRVEKLRPYIINILKKNNVSVRFLELKKDDKTKGDKVLDLINRIPSVKQIDVYDDRNVEINSYMGIMNKISDDIEFNIFRSDNGNVRLVTSNKKKQMSENKIGVPMYLPQVNAPYTVILNNLDQDNIGYEMGETDPNELNPLQKLTFSDRVENVNLDADQPIWVSNSNDVLDGHHRLVKSIFKNKPIKFIKINLNTNDSCRVLNKYQDIFEYEQKLHLESEANDVINDFNDKDNELSNYIVSLEEENDDKKTLNQIKIIGYRKEQIKENSPVGNFFSTEPMEGFRKYEIEFENLLDTDQLGLSYKDSQNPVDILAVTWFPHINFDKIAEERGIDVVKIKNRAIAEKAKKIGYDGIKYGNKLIQGL